MKKITLLLILIANYTLAQIAPTAYYQFNSGSLAPTIGTTTLAANAGGAYTVSASGGLVGGYVTLPLTDGAVLTGEKVTAVNALTVEFLMKAGYNFGNARDMAIINWGNTFVKFSFPKIQFITKTTAGSDNLSVSLSGINRNSWGYYIDNNWHHIVCTYNATTGVKQIYVDGVCPTGFSGSTAPGTIVASTQPLLKINASVQYSKYAGSIDEVALYTGFMTNKQVYNDYVQVQAGNHYTVALSSTLPTPPVITAALDTSDYPVGYVLGSDSSSAVPSSAIEQLRNYRMPRFKPNHGLSPNVNVINPKYMAGLLAPGYDNDAVVQRSIAIQSELATNWNYYFMTNNYLARKGYSDTIGNFEGAWVAYNNWHKGFKTSGFSFWTTSPYATNQYMPNNHYVRNSSGQFVDRNGTVIASNKLMSPAQPLDSSKIDGHNYKGNLAALLTAMDDTLDFVVDNGEVLPGAPYNNKLLKADPYIMSYFDTTSFAPSDTSLFFANWQRRQTEQMRDSAYVVADATMIWTQYQVDGQDGTNGRNAYHAKYAQRRYINKNGSLHYPTFDYYPRYPYAWLTGSPGYRGWTDYIEARNTEIGLGDVINSPFVGFGWNANEEKNMRPGRSLGMCKLLNVTGAEFFYPGFFANDTRYGTQYAYPQGYVWQNAIPVYAQATASRYATILKHGYLLAGDMPDDYVNLSGSGYQYWAGDSRKIVSVRKDSTTNKYIICGTIQQQSNQTGNAPKTDTCHITLAGENIKFNVRQQGSVYYYDNTNTSAKVFYQLDEADQWEHPERWSKNIAFTAAVYDSSRVAPPLKTYRAYGSAAGDYTSYVTAISYADTATVFDSIRYYFTNRTDTTFYVWFRMRSRDIAQTSSMKFTYCPNACGGIQTIIIAADTVWKWYRTISSAHVTIDNLDSVQHQLIVLFGNKYAEIDRMVLSVDSNEIFTPEYVPGGCGTVTVTIDTSGATRFCANTGSVTLTASATNAATYLWSTGETTASITSDIAATYIVTVTDLSGCSGGDTIATTTYACACQPPTGLASSKQTQTTVTLNFTKPATPYAYKVYLRKAGTTTPVTRNFDASSTTVIARNLQKGSTYYVKVKTLCLDFTWSAYSDSIAVSTKP